MANHPLEIILRANGKAELVDSLDHTLWSSDADEDFREQVSQEFLTEDDVDDILDYLSENNIITEREARKFEDGEWDVTEESMPAETGVDPVVGELLPDDFDEEEDD